MAKMADSQRRRHLQPLTEGKRMTEPPRMMVGGFLTHSCSTVEPAGHGVTEARCRNADWAVRARWKIRFGFKSSGAATFPTSPGSSRLVPDSATAGQSTDLPVPIKGSEKGSEGDSEGVSQTFQVPASLTASDHDSRICCSESEAFIVLLQLRQDNRDTLCPAWDQSLHR